MIGRPWTDLVHPVDVGRVRAELGSQPPDAAPSSPVEARVRHADGRMVHTESTVARRGESSGWVLTTRDITERVRLRDELAAQARTDPLTGLLNRAAFLALADERLRSDRPAIVLFIDLDQFKAVNDTSGHAVGDELLCDVAARLRTAVGPGDVIARLGGDEFAVLTRTSDLHRATATAGAVVDAVAKLELPGGGRHGAVSVGIAEGSGHPRRRSSCARPTSRCTGRRTAAAAAPSSSSRGCRSGCWSARSCAAGSRSRSPTAGCCWSCSPSSTSPPAPGTGSRRWCAGRTATAGAGRASSCRWPRSPGSSCRWAPGCCTRRWRSSPRGRTPTRASPSTSRRGSSRRTGSPGWSRRALETAGIAPERLTLEITEQTAVDDLGRTASRLAPLRDLGIHVAVDDFGTGFSSMRYLTRLPVDALKIDRQFVDGLGVRSRDEVLVVSMLRLAADLDLEVIAEGVETAQQAEILPRARVHAGAGLPVLAAARARRAAAAERRRRAPRPRGGRPGM